MAQSLLKRAVQRVGVDGLWSALSPQDKQRLEYFWPAHARPEQLEPPGAWRTWLVLAGRGYGKTRLGAETIRLWVEGSRCRRLALVAPTAADARDVMVEGESGLLPISPPWFRPLYEPSKRRLTWPNGAQATLYSADEPERLRGPQHDGAWIDELAAWRYPEALDQLRFGLRLGKDPRIVATTTPKPLDIIRQLVRDPSCIVTRGRTRDNADNLAPGALADLLHRYDGTRLGRQELDGDLLEDTPGALWTMSLIDRCRVREAPALRYIVVGVDPSGSAKKSADTAGIVVAGVGDCPCKGKPELHAFVLQDLSGRYNPDQMARVAIDAYHDRQANLLVAEDNFGGEMIRSLMHLTDPLVHYEAVHASRGKIIRAEPVAALYEQQRVHHVGVFKDLEDELCCYAPLTSTESPGRLDAVVWALTRLMLGESIASFGKEKFVAPQFTFGVPTERDDDD